MKLVKDINKESSNKPQVNDKEAEEAIKKYNIDKNKPMPTKL